MGGLAKTIQAYRIETVEPSQTDVSFEKIKGIRCDVAGTLTLTLNQSTPSQTLALVAGEVLPLQGSVTVSTDSNARVHILS